MNKKTIWITGGSTGIGKALAIKFANEGWNVAISARRENLLREISDNHENINSFPLDVTNKDKCKEVFNNIKNQFENIDICFFSTGTWNPKKEKDIDVEQIEGVFKVNFFGTLNSIKAVEEYFKKKLRVGKKRITFEGKVYRFTKANDGNVLIVLVSDSKEANVYISPRYWKKKEIRDVLKTLKEGDRVQIKGSFDMEGVITIFTGETLNKK